MRRAARCAFIPLLFFLGRTAAPAQPRLDLVGGPTFDFGELFAGETVRHDLKLRNTGTDTLVIMDVSAACGCTSTLISGSHIPPNESGTLSITFSSKQLSGRVQKVVTFNTTDTSHGHVRITFTANVVKSLTLEPEYLVFRTGADSAVTADVEILNTGTAPVRILSTKSTSGLLKVDMLRERIAPGERTRMRCSFSPKGEGLMNGTITIQTDRVRLPEINVRFFAQVGPPTHSN